jgi:hypothetical protein
VKGGPTSAKEVGQGTKQTPGSASAQTGHSPALSIAGFGLKSRHRGNEDVMSACADGSCRTPPECTGAKSAQDERRGCTGRSPRSQERMGCTGAKSARPGANGCTRAKSAQPGAVECTGAKSAQPGVVECTGPKSAQPGVVECTGRSPRSQERMNSPLELREVRLRGLLVRHAAGVHQSEVPQVKPRAVCEAFRCRCGGFSRSRRERCIRLRLQYVSDT